MTLVKHGKKAWNPDLKLEDLCLTSSIEAMTHWVSSASFLHVEIFLKGLFQDWKDLTTHLSFVSLEKCHFLRRSSCRDHAPSNICNQIAAFSPIFKVNEIIPSAWHQKVDITFVSSYVVSSQNWQLFQICLFLAYFEKLRNIFILLWPMWQCFCWRSVECNNTITMGPELLQLKITTPRTNRCPSS